MGLNRCKLIRKVQLRLLEFFVLEVTARSAADVLDLQANTVALFYRKVRELIVEQAAANEDLLGGEVEVDESYFGGARKGKRGARCAWQGAGIRFAETGRKGLCRSYFRR